MLNFLLAGEIGVLQTNQINNMTLDSRRIVGRGNAPSTEQESLRPVDHGVIQRVLTDIVPPKEQQVEE